MLDTTLFNINLPPIEINVNKPGDTSLILTGCRVELSENIVYSELDELNYYSLNCNDYNYGRADIELSYEKVFK
ncbi:MAG: hypothetical protein GX237_08910, partial [Clostridiales bacterium]|nr:hypothetical protein [Clostridiales bacterium]